ncbi:MAG: intradiol ring-cleavage dioxygenase [Rubrivivax sp.]
MPHPTRLLQAMDHGEGLVDDWPRMAALARRRRLLSWLAAGSALALAGCGGGSSSDGTTGSTAGTDTGTGSTGGSGTTAGNATCTAYASETNGPYPADGTNSSSGATSDVLTASGVVRSDIRSSFISSTTTAPGVPLTLTLTLVNTNSSCAPLSSYAVYIWHCTRDGLYSLYTVPAESYLRGVQVSDANGQLTFTTIFPGCYSGRWPHIHLEVFSSLTSATNGRNSLLISQLAMPSAACSAVYSGASGYTSSTSNFARISIASDNVFGDNSSAQIAAMTPTLTGSVAAGYSATAVVGLAR